MSNPEGWVAVAGALGFSAVIAVLIWSVMGVAKARVAVSRELEYKKLAQQATEAQQSTADRLQTLVSDMAELRTKVASMEKLLREVE
jgi:hypothetical protein